ncbi:hypothetical protein F5884DRAFT_815097 [Xylogone sp. PMI_703]|nr:hypothetical protein F5884DRAFT_815097 [Xylogone sp. PMI_703]
MVLSEVIRFVLPPTSTIYSSIFRELREYAKSNGNVKDQYFGYITSPIMAALPKSRHEICWVIQWPKDSNLRASSSWKTKVNEMTQSSATSLLFEFEDDKVEELSKAIDATICEFAVINLSASAPLQDQDLQRSMHKTYTDTYHILGFTGGNWAYARNTNDTSGVPLNSTKKERIVPKEERRLACYYLGWESAELHQDGSTTPYFAEEMEKLQPWFGPGTGAFYVTFRKHI